MTSILTNNSALVALQTLRSINQNLATTQSEISSGKKVATAKDNASFFAISAVMQSDVSGFKAISESLSLADATVGVARSGAETVTSLLNDLKSRVIAAQDENVDRAKIQADVVEIKNQIAATIQASQFNGLNLLTKTSDTNFVGSLNRLTATTVATSNIVSADQGTAITADLADATGAVTGRLLGIDVDLAGALPTSVLDDVEALIQISVDAASAFGSTQKRIENQSNFISKLSDSLTSGIGALVDVDLEAASARLQALQVQQQLGTQALSIANQQPQSILSLFR